MIEKAFVKRSNKTYWAWIIFLLAIITVGCGAYAYQMMEGFHVTGMSHDISWGLYIGHLTFFVGVAAGGVMIVLPYYFHNVKEYGRITVIGEFLAIAALIMALLFVVVDVGAPMKILNVWLYWTPRSMLCWDSLVIPIYLLLNLVVGYQVLQAENKGVHYKKWVKILAWISVPFAFSIHIVTAFLYAGLPSRHYFLTAVLPAKFLASAFATGPALIILICLLLNKLTGFNAGEKAIRMLATTAIYAFIVTIIMVLSEFFVAFYSNVTAHKAALEYLFFGLHGHNQFVPLMLVFTFLVVVALLVLIPTRFRYEKTTMIIGCLAIFISMYIEKGLTFVIGGLSENPFGEIISYYPTVPEIVIIIGVFAIGIFILSLLLKMAMVTKKDCDFEAFEQEDRAALAYKLTQDEGVYVDTRPVPEVEEVEEEVSEATEANGEATSEGEGAK